MDSENLDYALHALPESFMIVSIGSYILELLAGVVVLASFILIFRNSIRPGRVMMLFGFLFSLMSYLPIYVSLFIGGDEGYGSFMASIIHYSPIASGMFLLVSAGGLLMFALSFKNES
mgnify:CR=1 FL=1